MKRLYTLVFIFLLALPLFAQDKGEDKPPFDIAEFQQKVEAAQWLVEYDRVAWRSSDIVMAQDEKVLARLGNEWFCFKDAAGVWHAVYGKLSDDGYEAVLHFVADEKGAITPSDAKLDKAFLDSHARALVTAREKLLSVIPNGSPRFNQYIRLNSDKSFSVWMLPAFQTDGTAVYGGEGVYTIDAAGTKILKDESYFQLAFRGFMSKPPREIWLDYSELEKPTLGAVFFVLYYKPYFTKIFIDNKLSTTTLIETEAGFMWAHVVKEPEEDDTEEVDETTP